MAGAWKRAIPDSNVKQPTPPVVITGLAAAKATPGH